MNDKELTHMHRRYCRFAWLAAKERARFLAKSYLNIAKTYAAAFNGNVPNANPANAAFSVVKR